MKSVWTTCRARIELKMDPELIGITIQGPSPVGRVHLRLDSGLSVLYGLNGAGKTSILEAMRTALTGFRGKGFAALHVRYSRPTMTIDVDEVDDSAEGMLASDLDRWLTIISDGLRIPKLNAESGISALVEEILIEAGNISFDEEKPGIVREVARQGVFTLVSVGTREPEWTTWISGTVDETTPTLRQRVELEVRRATPLNLRDPKSGSLHETETGSQIEVLASFPDGEDPFPMLTSWLNSEHFPWRPGDPPWVPCAIQRCDVYRPRKRFVADLNFQSSTDLAERTAQLVLHSPVLIVTDDLEVGISERAQNFLTALSSEATEIIALLITDAPLLKCEFREPRLWISRRPLKWLALDRPSLRWVEIDQLSDSQRRWAIFAISLALLGPEYGDDEDWSAGRDGGGRVLILDEPERGLHARAQRQLARGLAELGAKSEWSIVAATHSAAFLDEPRAGLFHVSREEGLARVDRMTTSVRKQMEDSRLGIEPSELLQMVRTFLIVEGVHDQVVIEGLVGDELELARTRVVPMGGTHSLNSVIDAQLIFDYTSAGVVIALDRLRLSEVELNWRMTRELVRNGDKGAAFKSLGTFKLKCDSSEEKFLYEFLELAIRKSRTDRVEVFGFAKPDILEYLDATEFVEGESWDTLVSTWGHRGNFKEYLRSRGAKINSKEIAAIVERMNGIPDEFLQLVDVCRRTTLDGQCQ